MSRVTQSKKFEKFIINKTDENYREQTIYRFPNGYGASMIQLPYYHSPEMAVLFFTDEDELNDYQISYNTEITNDVIQGIEDIDVELQKVFDL